MPWTRRPRWLRRTSQRREEVMVNPPLSKAEWRRRKAGRLAHIKATRERMLRRGARTFDPIRAIQRMMRSVRP